MNNWKKILNELSYRVSSGIPDLTNEQHLLKLWDILKEEKWPIDARVELLKNLNEQDKPSLKAVLKSKIKNPKTGNLIQVSTGLGYKDSNVPAYTLAKSKLNKSGYGEDEVEKISKQKGDEEKPQEREPLSPERQQELNEADSKDLDKWLNMTKEESLNQSTDDDGDSGAGDLESKAGEAVTVAGAKRVKELMTTPPKKTYEEARAIVEKEMMSKVKKGSLLKKEWVQAGLNAMDKLHETFGIDKIKNFGWDTKSGRELVGSEGHGTSSDMFVELEDGTVIGVSLKKDFKVFIVNGGMDKSIKNLEEKLGSKLPDNCQSEHYKKRRTEIVKKGLKKLNNNKKKVNEVCKKLINDRDHFEKVFGPKEVVVNARLRDILVPDMISKDDFNKLSTDEKFELLKKFGADKLTEKVLNLGETGKDIKFLAAFCKDPEIRKEFGIYEELRALDNEMTTNIFEQIRKGGPANDAFKESVVKDLHLGDTLFGKPPQLDNFTTIFGENPPVQMTPEAITNIFGVNEEYEQWKNEKDPKKKKELEKQILSKIKDNLVVTKAKGKPVIAVKVTDPDTGEVSEVPLYELKVRTKGIGNSPGMEISQGVLGSLSLKNGTADFTKWPDEDKKKFASEEMNDIQSIVNDEDFDYEQNKEELKDRLKKMKEVAGEDDKNYKKLKALIDEQEKQNI